MIGTVRKRESRKSMLAQLHVNADTSKQYDLRTKKNDLIWVINFQVWLLVYKEIFLERLFWPTVKLLKWLSWLNHFHKQINKGHLKKAGGYNGRNIVIRITTIKMRSIIRKIAHKIIYVMLMIIYFYNHKIFFIFNVFSKIDYDISSKLILLKRNIY